MALQQIDSTQNSAMLQANTTVNLTSSMSAATIQTYINAQPKNLNGYTLTFQFADGTYTLSSALLFSNFCAGTLNIQGDTGESGAGTLHTTQSVILNFASSNGLYVFNNTQVTITNLKINFYNTPTYSYALNLTGNNYTVVYGCYFTGASSTSGTGASGLNMVSGFAYAYYNYFANYSYAIFASNPCRLSSYDNQTTGSGTTVYGLYCQSGASISYNLTQPTGGTAATGTGGASQLNG
jgi:hypothetical protein